MAAEFRCENCGNMVSADDRHSGDTIQCPHCRKNVSIPAGLASLPRPHVPPNAPRDDGASGTGLGGSGLRGSGLGSSGLGGTGLGTQTLEISQGQEQPPATDPEDATMVIMAKFMPWVVSIFLHAALALIMAFVVMLSGSAAIPDFVLIPDARLNRDLTHRLRTRDLSKTMVDRTSSAEKFSRKESEIDPETGVTVKQIGLITGSSNPLAGLGAGADKGMSFMGVQTAGGNIHHIVWVIDRSGSMMDSFEMVKRETATTIGQLVPEQDFHVILFSDGPPEEISSKRLMPATEKAKLEAVKFLKGAMALDQTDPIPALRRAFAVLKKASRKRRGKLIYLLTDGVFPNNKTVLDVIRMENPGKKVLINTFLYGKRPPVAVRVLKTIAMENGGVYKWISPDE